MTTIRQQIADRVRDYDNAQSQPLFLEVADSGQLDDVLSNMNVTEGCYVIKLERNATDTTPYQRVTERYQVVTICQNHADAYGTAAGEIADAMQGRVFAALGGHVVTDTNGTPADPLLFITGGLVDLHNQIHVWADIYQLEYTQTHQQP